MKYLKFLFLAVFFMAPGYAGAQSTAPKRFTLEAVLVDNGGNVLFDLQEADLRIWITDGSGETLYEETQHVMVSSGAMAVMVGDGSDSTGALTGGVPYEALNPDGEKRLNFQIMGDSIPQEELELGSVPYAYYSQYAIDLPTDTVTTDHILNSTITLDDFSAELVNYMDSSMTGISAQDLLDHKSEDGAHPARSISVENTFVNIAGTDLQTAIEAIDAQLNMRTSVIGDETAAREAADTTLQSNIDSEASTRATADTAEASTRAAADTTLQTNIDSEATTRSNADTTLQSNINTEQTSREAADTALDGRVDTLETTATDLQTQITQEVSDRQAADAVLQTNITDEATTRANADTALQTGVTNAQSTANTALTNAATAQTTANSAAAAAGAAQSTANTALTNAATAQGTANTAVTNAATAQGTANTALTNATTAQTTADTAQADVDALETTVSSSDDSYVNESGDIMDCLSGLDPCLTVEGNVTINGTLTTEGISVDDNDFWIDVDVTVADNLSVGGHVIIGQSILDSTLPEEGSLYRDNLVVAWANVAARRDLNGDGDYNDLQEAAPYRNAGFNINPFISGTTLNPAGTCSGSSLSSSCSGSCRDPDGTGSYYDSSYYKLCFKRKPNSASNGTEVDSYVVMGNIFTNGSSSTDNAIVVTKIYSNYFIIRTVDAGDLSNSVSIDHFMVMVLGWEN